MHRLRKAACWGLVAAVGLAVHLACYPLLMRWVVEPNLEHGRHQFHVSHFERFSLGFKPFAGERNSGDLTSRRPFSFIRALAVWRVTQPGRYLLKLTCDDFGSLALDGQTVLSQKEGLHSQHTSQVAWHLRPGSHLLDVGLTNWQSKGFLELRVQAPGEEEPRPLGDQDLVFINLSNLNAWMAACDMARLLGWLAWGLGLLAGVWCLVSPAWRAGLGQRWRAGLGQALEALQGQVFPAALLLLLAGYFAYYHLGLGRFALPVRADGFSWYAFLPAYLAWLDPTLASLLDPARHYGYLPWDAPGLGLPHNTLFLMPSGYYLNQCPIGVSVLMLPFFLAGHYLAVLLGEPADGFSFYYQHLSALAAPFYAALGLWFLSRLLGPRHGAGPVLATLACLLLGTNLFNYATSDVAMSHAYSFCLLAAFLWTLDRWEQDSAWPQALWLGVVAGLIALTRTQNLLVLLLLPLNGLGEGRSLGGQAAHLWARRRSLLLMALAAALVFSPQLLVWKLSTGQWFFNSLSLQERQPAVDLLAPQLGVVLFSLQRGIVTWFPLTLTALAGLCLAPARLRPRLWPTLLVLAVMVYGASCFWDPTFGFGYGLRVLVDWLPLLAPAMAAFWQWVSGRRWPWRLAAGLAAAGLMGLNLRHVHAYWTGRLSGHPVSITLEELFMLWAG